MISLGDLKDAGFNNLSISMTFPSLSRNFAFIIEGRVEGRGSFSIESKSKISVELKSSTISSVLARYGYLVDFYGSIQGRILAGSGLTIWVGVESFILLWSMVSEKVSIRVSKLVLC